MFGIGEGELAIILVFGFLLFGPDKLPQMGRTIGRAIRQFKETQEKMTAVVQSEIIDPVSEAAQAPLKPEKASDADDDDDDETTDTVETGHRETFAERRARLAAEKAAADGAAEDEDGEDGDDGDGEAAVVSPGADDGAAEPESEPAPEEPDAEPEPEVKTTADLYARRPRKHKAVVEELAAELAAEEAAADTESADAPKGGDE